MGNGIRFNPSVGGSNGGQPGGNFLQTIGQNLSSQIQQMVSSGKMSPDAAQALQQKLTQDMQNVMQAQNPQQREAAMQQLKHDAQQAGLKTHKGKHKGKHHHHGGGAGAAQQRPQALNPYNNLSDTFSRS